MGAQKGYMPDFLKLLNRSPTILGAKHFQSLHTTYFVRRENSLRVFQQQRRPPQQLRLTETYVFV